MRLMPFFEACVLDDMNHAAIMADYIEDYCDLSYPEAPILLNNLRKPKKVTLRTLFETVALFGTPKERHDIRKIERDTINYVCALHQRITRNIIRKVFNNFIFCNKFNTICMTAVRKAILKHKTG